jgi:hypothetical protein
MQSEMTQPDSVTVKVALKETHTYLLSPISKLIPILLSISYPEQVPPDLCLFKGKLKTPVLLQNPFPSFSTLKKFYHAGHDSLIGNVKVVRKKLLKYTLIWSILYREFWILDRQSENTTSLVKFVVKCIYKVNEHTRLYTLEIGSSGHIRSSPYLREN